MIFIMNPLFVRAYLAPDNQYDPFLSRFSPTAGNECVTK